MLGSHLDFAMGEPTWIVSTQNKGDCVKKNSCIFSAFVNLHQSLLLAIIFHQKQNHYASV